MSYVTLTFLGMLLVLQSCFASHHEYNTDNKLYKETAKALVEIAIPLSERYCEVLEKVVEDLKAHEEAPKYEHQIEHLEKLIEGFKHIKADTDEEILQNIIALKDDGAGAQEPSNESSNPHLVRDLFEKDGGKELAEEIRKDFVEFFDGFDDAFEKYAKEMSEEEKAEHEDFLKCFKEFKESDNFEKKLEKFFDFFKFFHHKE
ncbi:uncharacterized protein LOC119633825 [Glossina fuscipes]|uniref:Uncharacterized protein LOC119633825 n=1 Tax=Glossina fuscipes TaxID=7396 RepID=A0A8U0WEH9_9MUSC|nr:uncharacterized protein LOC119633825 [Glossina fuscipes]KAI9585171.1 hypothetical protein GQX74_001018 [Glossina fuscipes]